MKPKTESSSASLAVIGVDIGKEVFPIVGFDVDAFEELPPAADALCFPIVGGEAGRLTGVYGLSEAISF